MISLEARIVAAWTVCDNDEEMRSLPAEIFSIAEKSHPEPVPEPGDFVLSREGRTELTFRQDKIPELEAWLVRTEAEIGKPVYGIRVSRALESLLSDRCDKDAGFSKVARAAADQILPGTDTTAILRGMRTYSRITGTSWPATVACMHSNVLVFSGPEQEVLSKVHNLVVPAKKAAPEKVAAKMALSRIKKLHDTITAINKATRLDIARRIGDLSMMLKAGIYNGQSMTQAMRENLEKELETLTDGARDLVPELPLDSAPDQLRTWVESVRHHPRRRSFSDALREMDRYLGRPDATDAVLQAGMDLVRAEEVMDA